MLEACGIAHLQVDFEYLQWTKEMRLPFVCWRLCFDFRVWLHWNQITQMIVFTEGQLDLLQVTVISSPIYVCNYSEYISESVSCGLAVSGTRNVCVHFCISYVIFHIFIFTRNISWVLLRYILHNFWWYHFVQEN